MGTGEILQLVRTYSDLRVWQGGMAIAEECYRLTKRFPREGLYGETSQIRRAASSVPANIAKGVGGKTGGKLSNFPVSLRVHSRIWKHSSYLPHESGLRRSPV